MSGLSAEGAAPGWCHLVTVQLDILDTAQTSGPSQEDLGFSLSFGLWIGLVAAFRTTQWQLLALLKRSGLEELPANQFDK